MTLNGIMAVFCFILQNSITFAAHCIKVVEDICKLSTTGM